TARCAAGQEDWPRPGQPDSRNAGSPRFPEPRIAGETGPGLVLVGTPERNPDPARCLTALRLAHRASADPAAPDRVATTHCSPPGTSAHWHGSRDWARASAVQQQIQPDDAEKPDDAGEDREPVEVALNHGRRSKSRGHSATEQVRQATALALVQQHQ